MITDVFHKRYPITWVFPDGLPAPIQSFLRQCAGVIFEDLMPLMPSVDELCTKAYGKLARELGHGLCRGNGSQETCAKALCESYDLWNNTHGPAEVFFAWRLSLIELLLAEIQAEMAKPTTTHTSTIFRKRNLTTSSLMADAAEKFDDAVLELNNRLQDAGIPFHYHNGKFQHSTDRLTQANVHEPFWTLVSDPKWINVDLDMKEAIDRHDNNRSDAALSALMALESVIKIISTEKGWTRGTENGPSNYIDNLVSNTNGRFIDVWEADQLKSIFRNIRNPLSHGSGHEPQPTLRKQQEKWVIDWAMIWIKSLITRL